MIKIKRLKKSFKYATKGIIIVFQEEQNFKIHFIISIIVLMFGFYFHIKNIEWAFLVITISFVFLAEILNSALERVADILKPRINNYVKEIKDIMAGAVLIASLTSVLVGLIIFLPYFLR